MININNIVRGICKMPHDSILYEDEIDEFCKLMCKPNFAHKVSKTFDFIYSDNNSKYIFDPNTEEDQNVNPKTSIEKGRYLVRMIDEGSYIVIKDYIHTVSDIINSDIAKEVVEKGIDYLPSENYA